MVDPVAPAQLQWSTLPRGIVTGFNWSDGQVARGVDPYLVWAEASYFSGYGAAPEQIKWLPLLIELAEGVSIQQLSDASSRQWLKLPAAYLSGAAPDGLRFCTARVSRLFFDELRRNGSLRALIRRYELGLPAGVHAPDPEPIHFNLPAAPDPSALLTGKVLGLIDGGVAFAHANFLDSRGKPRIRYLWRQDNAGAGGMSPTGSYGHELRASDILTVMDRCRHDGLLDESAVYQALGASIELHKRLNHGTHVLDVACGPRTIRSRVAGLLDPAAPPSWERADDDASQCPIVAVQLDWDTVRDTSGGSMTVHIMDGLMYILSRCAAGARVAVNLSWGTLAGPHDGTSILEAAMAQLIDLKRGELSIVLPASNGYQSRTHANGALAPGEKKTLNWRGPPADKTQNFVEIWFGTGGQDISIQITPPGHPALPPLKRGKSRMWTAAGDGPVCALIFPKSVAIADNGSCALVAVAPTFSFDPKVQTAPAGVWKLTIRNKGSDKVVFDAYVERDDEIIGVRTGALQSRFEDDWYDTSGNPESFVDAPDNPSLIRRSGTFNSIATGAGIVAVCGTRLTSSQGTGTEWARYSPRDTAPTPPCRPGVLQYEKRSAPSDENAILRGLGAAGSRSGSVVRMVGTSDAAPQVTRDIFNRM